MRLFYIDDSKDETLCVYSALSFDSGKWRNAFGAVKAFRSGLKSSDGILLRTEFHATDFVAGRGSLGPRLVFKGRRCQLFVETLEMITAIPSVSLINACGPPKLESRIFERLLNRINRSVAAINDQAFILCDKGKESEYTRLARKMSTFNPIPSAYGNWDSGKAIKNIPTDRIIEDIIFKDSKSSYFIQLADFCAYALLRRERPIPSKAKYGLDRAFDRLGPILNREACKSDPDGIVRC